jgi:hypothetical protein
VAAVTARPCSHRDNCSDSNSSRTTGVSLDESQIEMVSLLIWFVPALLAFSYFYKHDPELIERRLRRKKKVRERKFIMKLVYVTYVSSSTLSSHGVALLLYLPARRL